MSDLTTAPVYHVYCDTSVIQVQVFDSLPPLGDMNEIFDKYFSS